MHSTGFSRKIILKEQSKDDTVYGILFVIVWVERGRILPFKASYAMHTKSAVILRGAYVLRTE